MTEERKDFRVKVSVRNNNLLRAIEAAGYEPGQKFSEASECDYGKINNLINMTESPLNKKGFVKPIVDRLCIFLNASFDELFSADQVRALDSNKTEKEVGAEELFALINNRDVAQIEHDDGLSKAIDTSFERLNEREKKVINLRFGLNGNDSYALHEIGDSMGVTQERIRQIEAKALRKLRYPCPAVAALRDFV